MSNKKSLICKSYVLFLTLILLRAVAQGQLDLHSNFCCNRGAVQDADADGDQQIHNL